MVSRKTRKRLEGLKQLGTLAARQNPIVDNMVNAKEGYEGAYKVAKARNPPSTRDLLNGVPQWIMRFERREKARERAMDRRFSRYR